MFTIRQIELFIAVSKSRTLIEVANAFKMSQSAVSMSLKELENHMEEKLFERIGKKLVLNERGRVFLNEVQPLFVELKALHQNFTQNHLHGEINIAASFTTAHYLMPPLMTSYMQKRPEVSISMRMANTDEIVQMIENGEADLGLIEGSITSSQLVQQVIAPDELIVISSDAILQTECYIDQLLHKKWILREKGSGTRSVFLNAIKPIDKELSINLELEDTEAIKRFLLLDDTYISCLPRISVQDELSRGTLFHVPIKQYRFMREFSLVYNKKRTPTLLMEDFHQHIVEYAKKLSA